MRKNILVPILLACLTIHGEEPPKPVPGIWSHLEQRAESALLTVCPLTGPFMVTTDLLRQRASARNRAYTDDHLRDLDVALMGDSLSSGFHASSTLESIYEMRTVRSHNWFLDWDPSSNSVYSFFERLSPTIGVRATNHARASARVDGANYNNSVFHKALTKVEDLSEQVSDILSERELPNLLISWIGANNLNWLLDLRKDPRLVPRTHVQELPYMIEAAYEEQMWRLLDRGLDQEYPVALMVFGLIDFPSYFQARDEAERLHAQNPELYPWIGRAYSAFEALKPSYRPLTLEVWKETNRLLEAMVDRLNARVASDPRFRGNVQVFFSPALSELPIQVEDLNDQDAWHPSVTGANRIAETALGAIHSPLEFLGLAG